MAEPNTITPDPAAIGGIAKPPFARLPAPARLFAGRAARFRTLAAGSELGPYLNFLADLAAAQAGIVDDLPPIPQPEPGAAERARAQALPPLDRAADRDDPVLAQTFDRLFTAAATIEQPAEARAALAAVASSAALRDEAAGTLLRGEVPTTGPAEHAYVAAGLHVHFARRAAGLAAGGLGPVGVGACAACGGPPVSSIIVGWIGAEGARYCACSLCSTLWNVVRVTCTLCGTTGGIGYAEVEGGSGAVKAETCEGCGRYVKILQGHKHPGLDSVADDVASLGLDLLLQGGAFRRGGVNAFLLGY